MRHRKLVQWTAAVAVAWGLGIAAPIAAEETDAASCEEACYDAEDACFEKCAGSDDISACEDVCVGKTDACVERCE